MFKPTQSYSSPTTYSKTYDKFRGVDFSSDPSKVASYRSPDAVNMISDAGGMPEKRVGWRNLTQMDDSIRSLHCCEMVCSGVSRYENTTFHVCFAYADDTVLIWTKELGIDNAFFFQIEEPSNNIVFFNTITKTIYIDGITDYKGIYGYPYRIVPAFICANKMFVVYDVSISSVPMPDGTWRDNLTVGITDVGYADGAYAPITSVDRSPDGTQSDANEPVNLLTRLRRNRFKGDGTSTVYVVDAPIELDTDVIAYDLNTGSTSQGTIKDADKGEVSFSTALPKATGADDNIEITFLAEKSESKVDLGKCTLATNFTVGAQDNRVILSGHPDFPNYEWYSASNEGLYFPDINYNIIGLATSAIKGYCDYGQYQVIAKEGDGTPNVYLRSYTENKDGELVFTLTQGNVSADALGATSTLNGQPLFLSSSGVIGLVSTAVKSDTAFNNVSYFINNKLLEEPNLEKAFAVHHKQKVYIFVNGHVYILDGTQNKAYVEAAVDDYSYECFYWDDVPATCAMSDGETIWFGTADGYICRFNNDMNGYDKYNNYDINGNATPVKAHWCTALDYDNSVGIAKTLVRKGTTVTLKPANRTSADIYVRTDDIPFELVAQFSINKLSFRGFSFKGLVFEVRDAPLDVPVSAVVKNYSYLQIKVQNDKLSEPFGLYGITKYFRKGRYK